ncbi:MAG TPA: DUF4249 family protein [Bacteroidia bacterium]
MRQLFFKFICWFIISLVVSSCTTVIQVSVPTGKTQLVVDAFLDNSAKQQTVRLTMSANYFSEVSTPPVLGATVSLTDLTNTKTYTFTPDNNGNYLYTPIISDTMGRINHKYQLNVSYNGNTYFALSTLFPSIPVDTILFRFNAYNPIDTVPTTTNPNYYPLVKAKDIRGTGNCYWMKAYKNGIFYSQPGNMNFFGDAGGFAPDGTDIGVPNSYEGVIDNDKPYQRNDVCTIEIYAINAATSDFLGQLQTQMTNSQSGLFAVTPQNVKTNIQQTSGTQPAIGWFNIGAITSKSVVAR